MSSITGTRQFKDAVNMLSRYTLKDVYRAAMSDITIETKARAMKKTPVDTGLLRSSAEHRIGRPSAGGIDGTVFYNANYAIYVHENLVARHKVGEAKFLEHAVNEVRPKVQAILNIYIKRALR